MAFDGLVGEAQPLDHAGPEILHQHVGPADQAFQGREVAGVLHVDGEAFLAAVDGMEQRRVAADLGVAEIKAAAQVAAVRPLDLDDARAEVHQPQRRVGAGEELAHVDDHEAGERRILGGGHGQGFSTWCAKASGSR